MKFYFLEIILFFSLYALAQRESSIQFCPTINYQITELGTNYYLPAIKDSIKIEALKFYISNVQFFHDEKKVAELDKKYWLVDIEKPESLTAPLPNPISNFNKINFNIGIDSLTNVSGAFGGDLDPTNGMYWTWQSGYINFKLEGVTNICPARNHLFQFHLGGYQAPFDALQNVELKIGEGSEIKINVAIDYLFAQIDLEKTFQIMSPNQQAVEMARLVASVFSISK
jgi:hypothetical protein